MVEQYSIEGSNNCFYKCSLILLGHYINFFSEIQEDGLPFHKYS